MKKLALILAILGCVSLSGCGEKAPRKLEEANADSRSAREKLRDEAAQRKEKEQKQFKVGKIKYFS